MPDGSRAPVVVVLPGALVSLFPGAPKEARVAGRTVAEVIAALDERWPGMRDRLCDSTPAVRRHINIFVAGERATLGTPVGHGEEIVIMTAISGG